MIKARLIEDYIRKHPGTTFHAMTVEFGYRPTSFVNWLQKEERVYWRIDLKDRRTKHFYLRKEKQKGVESKVRWFVVWFSGSYEEGPPVAAGKVRKAFHRKWKYKFTIEEYGERKFSIIIRGRNIAVERKDLKDLFTRDLMIDKVHVKELKL